MVMAGQELETTMKHIDETEFALLKAPRSRPASNKRHWLVEGQKMLRKLLQSRIGELPNSERLRIDAGIDESKMERIRATDAPLIR